MNRMLILMLAIITCAGCSSVPVKSGTQTSQYKKLLVRDINWKETATSEIGGEEMKAFIASQPMLNELFRTEFDRQMKSVGAFAAITYGNGQPDADTLVLVPKIYTLKPAGFMPGASYTGLLLSPDGKLIGTYAEERRLNQSNAGPKEIRENIEKLVRELAEDAASKLPYAR